MNQANTAWMLISTALVLLMTPALAFFYGGMVRSKNALNTMMMSFISLGFVTVAWALVGYSLAFGPGNSYVGDLSHVFLRGVGLEPIATIPHLLYMCYQATFCIITAALISGAIVERMRFPAYITFITLWSIVVYVPVAHWVWGGGWLSTMGALDFAGGTVVHVNAGRAALVAAIVLGPRRDYPSSSLLPHNVPFTMLGAGLLWFGWFGFNAGSAIAANGIEALAFSSTRRALNGRLRAEGLEWCRERPAVRKSQTARYSSRRRAGLSRLQRRDDAGPAEGHWGCHAVACGRHRPGDRARPHAARRRSLRPRRELDARHGLAPSRATAFL